MLLKRHIAICAYEDQGTAKPEECGETKGNDSFRVVNTIGGDFIVEGTYLIRGGDPVLKGEDIEGQQRIEGRRAFLCQD